MVEHLQHHNDWPFFTSQLSPFGSSRWSLKLILLFSAHVQRRISRYTCLRWRRQCLWWWRWKLHGDVRISLNFCTYLESRYSRNITTCNLLRWYVWQNLCSAPSWLLNGRRIFSDRPGVKVSGSLAFCQYLEGFMLWTRAWAISHYWGVWEKCLHKAYNWRVAVN